MLANRLDTAFATLIQKTATWLNPHRLIWVATCASYLAGWQLHLPILFGITALGLALLLISWLLPLILLRGVQVRMQATRSINAGEKLPVTLRWQLPFQLSHCHVREHFFAEPHIYSMGVLTPDSQRQAVSVIDVPTEYRSSIQVSEIELLCAAPFGLITHRKTLSCEPVTLAVNPQPSRLEWLPSFNNGQQPSPYDNEFQSVRDYRAGDARRLWHTTASVRSLSTGSSPVVREWVHRPGPVWLLVLDTQASNLVGEYPHSSFECAINLAASVLEYAARTGQACHVWADGPTPIRAVAGTSRVNNGLQQLAWLQPDTSDRAMTYADSIQQALQAHPDTQVLITIRNQTDSARLPSLASDLGHLDVLLQEKSFIYPVQTYDEGWYPQDVCTMQLKIHRSTDLERLFKSPHKHPQLTQVSRTPPKRGTHV